MKQQPTVALVAGVARLQQKGQRRREKIDHQKRQEINDQFLETRRAGRLRMEVPIDRIMQCAGNKNEIDERREQRAE